MTCPFTARSDRLESRKFWELECVEQRDRWQDNIGTRSSVLNLPMLRLVFEQHNN